MSAPVMGGSDSFWQRGYSSQRLNVKMSDYVYFPDQRLDTTSIQR